MSHSSPSSAHPYHRRPLLSSPGALRSLIPPLADVPTPPQSTTWRTSGLEGICVRRERERCVSVHLCMSFRLSLRSANPLSASAGPQRSHAHSNDHAHLLFIGVNDAEGVGCGSEEIRAPRERHTRYVKILCFLTYSLICATANCP